MFLVCMSPCLTVNQVVFFFRGTATSPILNLTQVPIFPCVGLRSYGPYYMQPDIVIGVFLV